MRQPATPSPEGVVGCRFGYTNMEAEMTLRMHQGYWTIFVGEQAVISCESLEIAQAAVDEVRAQLAQAAV